MNKNRIAGSALKLLLMLISFFLIGLIGYIFDMFQFSNMNWRHIGRNESYLIFVYIFLVIAAVLPVKIFIISNQLKKVLYNLTAIKDSCKERESIRVQYEKVLSSSKVVAHIWKIYKLSFIDSLQNEYACFSSRTRSNADLYFNAEEIVSYSGTKLPAVSLLRIVSGSFVGLGILGTFMGFSQALTGGIDIQNQEQLNIIVNGLQVAFNTSIFGLFSSIIYNFLITHPILQLLDDRCRFLSDELDSFFYISDEECLRILGYIVGETRKSIVRTATDTAQKVSEIIAEDRNSFVAELNKTQDTLKEISDSLEKTPKNIKDMNEELRNSIMSVKQTNEEMIKSIAKSIEDNIKASFQNFADRFEASSGIISTAIESIRSLPNQFDSLFSQSSEHMQESLRQIRNQVQEHLDSFISRLGESVDSLLCQIAEKNVQSTKEMLCELEKNLNLISESMRNSFKNCLDSSVGEFQSVINNVKEQLFNCYEDIAKSVVSSVDKMNCISETLSTVSSDYSKLGESFGNISGSIKTTEDFFVKLPQTMQNTVENLSAITLSTQETMDSISDIKELPTQINVIAKDLVKTINQLDTTYNATMDRINNLYNQIQNDIYGK